MGKSDNRKRGVKSRQNEKNREALIAVLAVCLIGILVTVITLIQPKSIHPSIKL